MHVAEELRNIRFELRSEFDTRIRAELDRAYAKHGVARWTRHEAYAIILEELDELWLAIKSDRPTEEIERELVQVAAMCLRYYETGNRNTDGEGL